MTNVYRQQFFIGDFVEFKNQSPGCVWRIIRTHRNESRINSEHTPGRVRWWHDLVRVHNEKENEKGPRVLMDNKGWDHQLREPSNPLLVLALAARE